jgi:Amt family ammonium transporter
MGLSTYFLVGRPALHARFGCIRLTHANYFMRGRMFDFGSVDTGATAWVLASSALVLLMTPGLAFFYGGMVRAKNVLGILMQNFATIALVSLVWVVVEFSLAFSKGNGFVGDLHFAGLQHMDEALPGYVGDAAQVIPPIVFVAFQLMFAVITPALITGATAERWRFSAFTWFIVGWSVLVYGPVAHWVFSPEGWAARSGALDFAGGTVVHINAGAAALAMAIVLGRRQGWPAETARPHNLPFVMLGTGLLWFGWFGFNSGSALAANNLAGFAFVNTNTATAAAFLSWIGVEKIRYGKVTTLGAASGAVSGLVAVTPCAGFISPLGALALGLVTGAVCALAVSLKTWLGYDDSLDVVGVHLGGGLVGSLAVGLLATTTINPAGADGLFYGGGYHQLGVQAIAACAVGIYSFVVTFLLGKFLGRVFGHRVRARDEHTGLDLSLHGELAYEFDAPDSPRPKRPRSVPPTPEAARSVNGRPKSDAVR